MVTEATAALFEAVKNGDIAQVRELVGRQPALVDARDAQGLTPTMAAHYFGRPEIAALLVERGAILDIFAAAAHGDAGRVRTLLAGDPALVGAFSPDGWTALALAAFFGREAAARALLDAGADPLARSRNSMANQPLHAAAAGAHPELVALLLTRGADPNAVQSGGFTALHAAAQNGDRLSVEALVAAGASTLVTTDAGKTPAALAREQGHEALAALLVGSSS